MTHAAAPYPQTISDYLALLKDRIAGLDVAGVEEIAAILARARETRRHAYVFGNGGSASVAAHLALGLSYDLSRLGAAPLAASSLSGGPAISAIANDRDASRVFADQLSVLAKPGDIAIGFSASGSSPNILCALDWARANTGTAIAVVGTPGPASRSATMSIILDCSDPAVAEDLFQIISHLLLVAIASTDSHATSTNS